LAVIVLGLNAPRSVGRGIVRRQNETLKSGDLVGWAVIGRAEARRGFGGGACREGISERRLPPVEAAALDRG
jgi:hypothetical protein